MSTQRTYSRLSGKRTGWVAFLFTALLLCASVATAQVPAPGQPWQFDTTGLLQEARLDGLGAGAHQGGHLRVNGHLITVPSDTIVLLPANQLTWQELFSQAPAPYGLAATPAMTGMAAADLPAPLTTYEVHVTGNVIPNGTGQGEYIAGTIDVSQQGLNSGQGYINFIDYALGEMRVGGVINDANCIAAPGNTVAGGPTCSGTRMRINDPAAKFSLGLTPDKRFTIDEDNPTVRSVTGFPMCLPRGSAIGDALCPQSQRPVDVAGNFVGSFTMADPTALPPGSALDPRVQAPFEVGDFITFAGTLVKDCPAGGCPAGDGPTAGPFPGQANTYITAHTINNNISIYTFPNTNPAYVAIDVTLLGTGGVTAIGLTEASARTRFEGFTTDTTRIIHIYGIDFNCDGTVAGNRDWGTIDVDPGPPTGAAKGRWRFRPPSKVLSMPSAGVFLPATREVRAVLEPTPGVAGQIPGWVYGAGDPTAANGLVYGQYHAPISEYIWPEQIAGNPVPPINIETVPFLANGGYASTMGTVAGQLNPWPGSPAPASSCAITAPAVTASASSLTVASGASINLAATATGSAPITFAWSDGGAGGTFAPSSTAAAPTWTAPIVAADTAVTLTVTATNGGGTATATLNVTVTAPKPPVITSAAASNSQVASNGTITLNAAATGATPISFQWTQSSGPAGTFTPATGAGASVTWTAPPVGSSTPASFSVIASNGVGSSAPATVNVTIAPVGAPVIGAIATQNVLVNTPVSIPVSATSTNTKANLTLAVTPNTFASFSINGPSKSCTATLCTFNWTVAFTAPSIAQTINLSLTATDTSVTPNVSSAPQGAVVNVSANPTPVVQSIAPLTGTSGTQVTMPVTATSARTTANLTLQVTQTTAFTLTGLATSKTGQTCTAAGCTFTFNVTFTRTLPAGQVLPDVVNFNITATDISVAPNLVSAPVSASVSVKPRPDTITVVPPVEYRSGLKQRLIITATSSVVSPNVVLTLQPYACQVNAAPCAPNAAGVWMYNPAQLGANLVNNGGGNYALTLVGAPQPACDANNTTPCSSSPLDIKSNLAGDSGFFALTRIR